MHVVVFTAGLVAFELLIETMERHFDLSSTGQVASVRHGSFVVISSGDCILVSLNKLGNHVPQKLHFSRRLSWHWWSEIPEVIICLFKLILNFFSNLWKRKLDMSEQDLSKLGGQIANT